MIKQVGVLFFVLSDLKCLSDSEDRDSKFRFINFLFFSHFGYLVLFVKNLLLCLCSVYLTHLKYLFLIVYL